MRKKITKLSISLIAVLLIALSTAVNVSADDTEQTDKLPICTICGMEDCNYHEDGICDYVIIYNSDHPRHDGH